MTFGIYARALLATLGLLTLVTSASAETAWVLWAVSTQLSLSPSNVKTEIPLAGFDTFIKCEALRVQEDARRLEKAPQLSGALAAADKTILLVCLPDTVDPRGPKGK
jgi:hypothetical protein